MTSLHKHRTIYQEKASRYISSHPKFYLTLSDINPHSLSHEIHKELHDFEAKSDKQTSLYNHLRTETTNFLSSYHTIQEKKEKDNERIKDKKLKSPFLDLINQYISRGYKIPDLSSNKNLFAPSILLSEPDKIVKLKETEITASRDLNYLKRVKNAVNRTNAMMKKKRDQKKYGTPLSVDEKSTHITPKNVQLNFFKLSEKPEQLVIKTPKEIENENKDLKSYNTIMLNCIKEFENDTILSQPRSRNFRTTTNASLFPRSTVNKHTPMRFEFPNILQTEPNKQFESPFIKRKITTKEKKINLFGIQPPKPKLIKSYNKCINILKNKTKQINNTLLNSPVNSFNLSDSNNNTTTITNFTDVLNKGIKQTLLTMDFSKKKEFSGDPVEFMTMIQKTKKNIMSYNFDNIKKIAMNGDSQKGKEMIDKIVNLDDKLMKMDKALIKSLENCKV